MSTETVIRCRECRFASVELWPFCPMCGAKVMEVDA